ncbi:hypothetical protein CALCODRAFT_513482 [Calocera cornea HHB12733]|uniref:Uncharacterized protein n=1 Tax=Calocera cornea HHB12733 TaxID=1353952 RepID=A0A165C1Y0_9BASI|nr:hypothetical protein CALCODRAFT_513482 [Calocera cornea HHB12733]
MAPRAKKNIIIEEEVDPDSTASRNAKYDIDLSMSAERMHQLDYDEAIRKKYQIGEGMFVCDPSQPWDYMAEQFREVTDVNTVKMHESYDQNGRHHMTDPMSIFSDPGNITNLEEVKNNTDPSKNLDKPVILRFKSPEDTMIVQGHHRLDTTFSYEIIKKKGTLEKDALWRAIVYDKKILEDRKTDKAVAWFVDRLSNNIASFTVDPTVAIQWGNAMRELRSEAVYGKDERAMAIKRQLKGKDISRAFANRDYREVMTEAFECNPSWTQGATEYSVYNMFDSVNREVGMVQLRRFSMLLKDEDLYTLQLKPDAKHPHSVTHVVRGYRCRGLTDAMGVGAALYFWLQGKGSKPQRPEGGALVHNCTALSTKAECIIDQVRREFTKTTTEAYAHPAECYALKEPFLEKLKAKLEAIEWFVPIIPSTADKELDRWAKHQEIFNLGGCFSSAVQILNGPGSGRKHGGPTRAEGWLRNLSYAAVGLKAELDEWMDAAEKFISVLNPNLEDINYIQRTIDKIHKDLRVPKALTAKQMAQINLAEKYPKSDHAKVPQFLWDFCRGKGGKANPPKSSLPRDAPILQKIGAQTFAMLEYEPRQLAVVADQLANPMLTQLHYLRSWVPTFLRNVTCYNLFVDITGLFQPTWTICLLDPVEDWDDAKEYFVAEVDETLGDDEAPADGFVTKDGLDKASFKRLQEYRNTMLDGLDPLLESVKSADYRERLEKKILKSTHRTLVAIVRWDERKAAAAAKKAAKKAEKKNQAKSASVVHSLKSLSIEPDKQAQDVPMDEDDDEGDDVNKDDTEDEEDDEEMKRLEAEDLAALDQEEEELDAAHDGEAAGTETGPSGSRQQPHRAARDKSTGNSPTKRGRTEPVTEPPAKKPRATSNATASGSKAPWEG